MPQSLAEEWKSAKVIFEGATKKKKPTEKFLGVFRKGTGIDAALKKADAAKTASELRKALAEFQKEAENYTKTLKAAAADPKSVKPEDKKHYVDSTVKLEKALEQLTVTGEAMATALDGTDKKTKVDPALLKEETECAAFLERRKKLEGVLKTVLADYKKQALEVDDCAAKATLHTANAKKFHLAGDQGQAMSSIGVVEGFKGKADGILKAVEDAWEERSTNVNGDMMKSRTDKSPPSAWPQDKKATYTKESNDAFGKYDAVQIQIQSVLSAMRLKVATINVTFEEAQTYTNQGLDPKQFVARLAELNKELEETAGWVARKLETTKNNIIAKKKTFETSPTPKNAPMAKQFTMMRDAEVKALAELDTRIQKFTQAVKRGTLIPQAVRSDEAIAPGFKQLGVTATKAKADFVELKKEQQTFIDNLNTYIAALT